MSQEQTWPLYALKDHNAPNDNNAPKDLNVLNDNNAPNDTKEPNELNDEMDQINQTHSH